MLNSKGNKAGGTSVFRVSDVVDVPLRGLVLRLRVQEGAPSLKELGPGAELMLRDTAGGERRVRIAGHPVTGGKPSQARLERTRELDVLLAEEEVPGVRPEIGWTVTGPVRDG